MKRLTFNQLGHVKPAKMATALAAAISACYAPTSFAAENSLMMEEIVVTVRRRVEMEQDVPISMKAMTEDYLREQNIGEVEDLGTKVPSLRISSAGGSRNEPLISLRGQRPSESIFAQDQAVPMYFNEVAMSPTQGSNLGIYDLQSIQVLKGPQGTLFGRNSTGGAILMTPKRPGTELGGYAEVKVGDYNLVGFEGAVDVPLTDNLQMRVAGHKLDRDGYQENIADNDLKNNTYQDEHSEGVRVTFNLDGDRFNNILVLAHDDNDINAGVLYATATNPAVGLGWAFDNGFLPSSDVYLDNIQDNIDRDDPWKIKSDVDTEEYVKNVFASNTTEFDINDDLTIKNVFGYRQVDFDTATDIDGTEYAGFGTWTNGATLPDVTSVTTNPRLTTLESEFFSNELQLLGSAFDYNLEWITGAYWSKLDATQDYLVQQAPGSFDSGITTAVNTSYGLFAEGTYTFNDLWSLTTGVRQSWDKRELTVSKWTDIARTNCNVTGSGGAVLTDCERTVDESFSSPTWRVSLNHHPEAGGLIYGSISTGYRGGGFNTRGNNDATLQPFDEEVVTTYELGHKADWDLESVSIRSSVAVYWQDYEDIHHTRSFQEGGLLVTRTENAAEAEIKGLEVDLTILPSDSLQLNFSYSYIDAGFKEKSDLIAGVGEVDTSGNDFVYIPEQSLTASATYTLPVDYTLGDMSLMVSVYWQDEMSTHPLKDQFPIMLRRFSTDTWTDAEVAEMTDFSEVDAYDVWNVRFDWRNVMNSDFDMAVYVNNATDEQYVLGGLNVVDSGGYGAYSYGAPRTVGASLRYSF